MAMSLIESGEAVVCSRIGRSAFSFIELLVVCAIIAIIIGFSYAAPIGQANAAQVEAAAEELAAVMRDTRSRALRENREFAISFNIQNAPGSSGRILNNRSGGHWYRVIGPAEALGQYDDSLGTRMTPPYFMKEKSHLNGVGVAQRDNAIRHYLELVDRCWVDGVHALPKGKVRFLALTDQDNGNNIHWQMGIGSGTGGGVFSQTYPRPWFGSWDANTQQLHAWGGYDPSIKSDCINGNLYYRPMTVNGRSVSPSGFCYEGFDGEISGSVNPIDRSVCDDGNNDGIIDAVDYTANRRFIVWKKGDARPLVNAAWLDYVIRFRPDGSVTSDWFRMRYAYASLGNLSGADAWSQGKYDGSSPSTGNPISRSFSWPVSANTKSNNGVMDRCMAGGAMEASSFDAYTGAYYITLAADVTNDSHLFESAEKALRSMSPIYRVRVSKYGVVQVVRVSAAPRQGDGRILDSTFHGTAWQNAQQLWGISSASSPNWFSSAENGNPSRRIRSNYLYNSLRNADLSPRGLPVTDLVTPEMLRDRKFWWSP